MCASSSVSRYAAPAASVPSRDLDDDAVDRNSTQPTLRAVAGPLLTLDLDHHAVVRQPRGGRTR